MIDYQLVTTLSLLYWILRNFIKFDISRENHGKNHGKNLFCEKKSCIFASNFINHIIMATIELRLSKIVKETGRYEILIRFFQGSKFDAYAKSEVFVNPKFFEYGINKAETAKYGISVPDNVTGATMAVAEKRGYVLRKGGDLISKERLFDNRRTETPELKRAREAWLKIDELKKHILEQYELADKDSITTEWLKDVIDRKNHPDKYCKPKEADKTIYELIEEYIATPNRKTNQPLAEGHARVFRVLSRAIARYEGFVRETQKGRKNFTFDINTVTREDIEDFSDYLRNEKHLSDEYPTIFKTLLSNYPANVKKGHDRIEERGENTVIKMRTRLKSLFLYCYDEGKTTNRPFDGVEIGTCKVGKPFYISINERNQIADADLLTIWEGMSKDDREKVGMPIQTLVIQRDIFIFQCMIGCRVGDLINLTESHIHKGILVYTPHKTKDDGDDAMQARVPLHPTAIALIKKYKGMDRKGRLFPFISAQKYNDAIKVIFKMAGVTRSVEVRNPLTGEREIRPINEIASSHLARRTFVGNAYLKVHDPNLIGKMSGHVEGSKAFRRYRNIEDSTLKEIIDMMG